MVIADDSSFFREVLREFLVTDGDIEVVAEARDGREAIEKVLSTRAQLLTLDIGMPGLGGLETIEELMARHPLPILVITALPSGPGTGILFEATRRGALDIVEKQRVGADEAAWLRDHIRQLATVPVVRHLKRGPTPAIASTSAAERGTARAAPALGVPRRMIGIGASAGGPPAVAAVLSRLPRDLPASVALVQHLSPGFASSYAEFLSGSTPLQVQVLSKAGPARPGCVYVAPDGHHLVARGDQLGLSDAPALHGHRPSVDALFHSMAQERGRDAIGVVLSGMGADGAAGLASLLSRGAAGVVQDEASSTIFGMPRAAAEAAPGATVLDLGEIAAALVRLVRGS